MCRSVYQPSVASLYLVVSLFYKIQNVWPVMCHVFGSVQPESEKEEKDKKRVAHTSRSLPVRQSDNQRQQQIRSTADRRPATACKAKRTTNSTMVKVWYEPPPYGPRTSLNRPSYGTGNDLGPKWVVRLSKMPPGRVIVPAVCGIVFLASIPLCE